jgi:hypothetical protein
MNTLWAITMLSVRRTVRSRVVLLLTPLLLAVALLLPGALKGDGTLSGQVQLSVGYTLGIIRFLLALAAVWTGCASISSDISTRRIYLVVTKPVSALHIWLGNWLGQVALLGVMLFVVSAVVYGSLMWRMQAMAVTPEQQQRLREEVLVARRVLRPDYTLLRSQAEDLYQQHAAAGTLPEGMTREQALEGLTEALILENNRVEPGEKAHWRFHIPRDLQPVRSAHVRYRLSAAKFTANIFSVTWLFGTGDGASPRAVPVTVSRGKAVSVNVPPAALPDAAVFVAELLNRGEGNHSLILPPKAGPELLCYAGGFAANYLRALLVMFCQLAFWTAAGVTAGCLFSLPVAAFATGWFALLSGLGGYLRRISTEYAFAGGSAEHGWMNRVFGPLYYILYQLVRPLESAPVLSLLTHGERIAWSVPGMELLVRVLIYCGLLALIGQYALHRRELGMPMKML